MHLFLAKSCGAKQTCLPILLDGETVIQGSAPSSIGQIDKRGIQLAGSLWQTRERSSSALISVIGVHVRRLAYAELLPRFPELAKPALFGKASGSHRLIGNVMWPLSRRVMMRMHDITPDAAAESRSILESELDWIDNTLADNRRYLSGDRFSRADITVASLLAFFAPPQRCRLIVRCLFPALSLPTANAGAIGR